MSWILKPLSALLVILICGRKISSTTKRYPARDVRSSHVRYQEGFEYVAVTSRIDYDSASKACYLMNGSLIDVKTDELHKLAMDLRKSARTTNLWTSGNNRQSGVWKWGDGTQIDVSSKHWVNWSSDVKEPNDGGVNNCLVMYIYGIRKGWADTECDDIRGYICQRNIDECINATLHNCHEWATCRDTIGSFDCACKHGFTGNGTHCDDINECMNTTLNNCHKWATCVNAAGNYSCFCKSGFIGNGTYCEVLKLFDLASNSEEWVAEIRGVMNCSETKLKIQWKSTTIGSNYNYKLYAEDIIAKIINNTSVEILFGSDPSMEVWDLTDKPNICSMTYEFHVSSDFSISAEVIAGRIVGDLVSVVTNVVFNYPSKTQKFVIFDAAGAD